MALVCWHFIDRAIGTNWSGSELLREGTLMIMIPRTGIRDIMRSKYAVMSLLCLLKSSRACASLS